MTGAGPLAALWRPLSERFHGHPPIDGPDAVVRHERSVGSRSQLLLPLIVGDSSPRSRYRPDSRPFGLAGTHNRLSSRCRSVVWLLTRRPGAVPGPVAGDLPEAGPRLSGGTGKPDSDQRGGNRPSDEPFELPGAQDRAQGVFPQPPKTAFSARPVDPEWINPIGRGSDEGRQERRIRAEQRMKGRKTGRIRPVGNDAGRMWGTPKPFENKRA